MDENVLNFHNLNQQRVFKKLDYAHCSPGSGKEFICSWEEYKSEELSRRPFTASLGVLPSESSAAVCAKETKSRLPTQLIYKSIHRGCLERPRQAVTLRKPWENGEQKCH